MGRNQALELGYGGVSAVVHATRLAAKTIQKGVDKLVSPKLETSKTGSQTSPGGGRKTLTARDLSLATVLDKFIEPCTSGDPMRPLCWSCKSTGQLARELTRQGHPVSADTVGRLLKAEQ